MDNQKIWSVSFHSHTDGITNFCIFYSIIETLISTKINTREGKINCCVTNSFITDNTLKVLIKVKQIKLDKFGLQLEEIETNNLTLY